MKLAVIFDEAVLDKRFTARDLEELKNTFDVSFTEGKATVESVKVAIKDAEIAITSWGSPALDKEILDCAPNLKLVIHAAGSVKPIVTDELWARGIRVISSAKPLGEGVAETALGFTISASKNFYNLNSNIHAGGYREGYDQIRELYDITVGVIGTGWAGRHYIELLQMFGVEVLAYDPFVDADRLAQLGAKKAEFEEVLTKSDIISIHAPSIPETYHMINAETLAMMKKDAILINTARGSIVDESALYEHMKNGNLKYACLDVYDPEPILPENPLRTLPNVILTPHLAGLAANGQKRLGEHSLRIAKLYKDGQPLECEVTEAMLATIA